MTQIDKETDRLKPCTCGRIIQKYTIGYSCTPFYVGCVCGKLVDNCSNLNELVEKWNKAVSQGVSK